MSAKVTGIRFVLTVPLYEQDILVMLGYKHESAAKIALNTGCHEQVGKDILNTKDCAAGVTITDHATGWFVLYMPELPKTASQHGSLIHEVFHVVEGILERVGMPHEHRVSSEAYAYLIGWITAQILVSLWEAVHAKPL